MLKLRCVRASPRRSPLARSLDGGEPQPPSLTLDVEATALVKIIPQIEIGLTAGAFNSLAAEAAVNTELQLSGKAYFQLRGGAGGAADHAIDEMPQQTSCDALVKDDESLDWGATCCGADGNLPYCTTASTCAAKHHLQLDVNLLAQLTVHLRIHASADFGFWADEYTAEKWFAPGGFVDEDTPYLHWNLHLASVCKLPLGGHALADKGKKLYLFDREHDRDHKQSKRLALAK